MRGRFAPPHLHAMALGVRRADPPPVNRLVVSHVPGPRPALRLLAGAQLSRCSRSCRCIQASLAIGLTSYRWLYFGLNGDREAMPKVRVLGVLIEECAPELSRAHRGHAATKRRPPVSRRQQRVCSRPAARPSNTTMRVSLPATPTALREMN